MKTLTERQREVHDFIAQFTDDNVYPPTVREIGDHFGISLKHQSKQYDNQEVKKVANGDSTGSNGRLCRWYITKNTMRLRLPLYSL